MGKIWIIVGFLLILAILSCFLIFACHPMDNPERKTAEAWMFKGAFATYQGQVSPFFGSININQTIQVIGLNATHVQIQTNSSISSAFAPTFSDQTMLWVNKTNVNFKPESDTLIRTYETEINVRNIGARACIALDYSNQAINTTYYLDKALLWPLRIVYVTTDENQTYQIQFDLNKTNINGLN
jgi:hypothetical protein